MVGFVLVVEGGPAAMDAMVNGGRGGNGGYVASGVLQRTVTERTCPMCPYCGDAMILLTLSDHFPADIAHQYHCLRCGASAPFGCGEDDAFQRAMVRCTRGGEC